MSTAHVVETGNDNDIAAVMTALGQRAKAAGQVLGTTDAATKNKALHAMAAAIRARTDTIISENEKDMAGGQEKGLSKAMLDRLLLTPDRIETMAAGIEAIAALEDPVGSIMTEWDQPTNGLHIERVRVPIGVIGIIYESRPNVTADAGALCLKSGNAVILRGGSESFYSSRAIHACLEQGLAAAGLPTEAIQIIPTTDRAAVGYLLSQMMDTVDIVIPRGGKNLIARVQQEARVPVLGHLEGLCHIYIDKDADAQKAIDVTVNAKLRRTGICGAAETVLIDKACDRALAAGVIKALLDAGCEVRGDSAIQALDPRVTAANDADWTTEYLDTIIAAAEVDGVDGAAQHIAQYGSNHTESIITESQSTADTFLRNVDSAIVMHNASTQFADGGEFGMGAEIGIATGKLHARGPVGVEQLTSFKYVVRGTGQVRP